MWLAITISVIIVLFLLLSGGDKAKRINDEIEQKYQENLAKIEAKKQAKNVKLQQVPQGTANKNFMKFICIDFETANMSKDSICQAGIVVVEKGIITETKSWLINPDSSFDDFNVRLHGISADMVKNSPKFIELWAELLHYFKEADFIVAHNARFDITALDQTLRMFVVPYNEPFTIHIGPAKAKKQISDFDFETPNFRFFDSISMARRTYIKEPSYSLQSLCNKLGIEYGNHDACADAKSCAELVLQIFKEKGVDVSMPLKQQEDFDALENILQISFGIYSIDGFQSSVCKSLSKSSMIKNIVGNIDKTNPDSIFYQKNVVFTGTLSSMMRAQAQQLIADIGGTPQSVVSNTTNYLIVGQQDYRVVGEDGMSSKQEKAVKMKEKGIDIEILSEDEFVKNI
jgi:DNA polymerase-3 subunit epsilon